LYLSKGDTLETKQNKLQGTLVKKSLDTELKQVTYIAMREGVDLHGDYTSKEEVRKAHASFAKSAQQANLFHIAKTDSFYVLSSYIAPTDMVLSGIEVFEGDWLMTLQIESEAIWELIKSDEICGISIGAMALVEEIEE
jgi:hypothetical protein